MTISGCFGDAAVHFVFHSGQPMPFSIFCLVFILISGSCLSARLKGKPYAERMLWLASAGTILLVAECILSLWIPFRKGALCFVLLSTGTCAYLLLLFTLLSERLQLSIQPLEALGRNALLCYMLSSILILAERAILPEDVSGGDGHGWLRRRDGVDLSDGDRFWIAGKSTSSSEERHASNRDCWQLPEGRHCRQRRRRDSRRGPRSGRRL